MTAAQGWAATALAVVLDLPAASLRADSPLDDLGADSVARVQWADVVEELSPRRRAPASSSTTMRLRVGPDPR